MQIIYKYLSRTKRRIAATLYMGIAKAPACPVLGPRHGSRAAARDILGRVYRARACDGEGIAALWREGNGGSFAYATG